MVYNLPMRSSPSSRQLRPLPLFIFGIIFFLADFLASFHEKPIDESRA